MTPTSARNVLASTTPNLEGWQIDRYLGTVSAHVVAGTNIFSDIAASWRDVFGGQSASYKKQLEQINEQVIGELKEEASQRGANGIVGLRIDHDQISGQGKEMFMVSATATAVEATDTTQGSTGQSDNETNEPISARELDAEVRKTKILERHGKDTESLPDDTWRFITENQISECAKIVEPIIKNMLGTPGVTTTNQDAQLDMARDYLLSIRREDAKNVLYNLVRHDKIRVMEWAVDILEDGDMLDLPRIEKMLDGEFYSEQKSALVLLTRVDKPYYEKEDIARLEGVKGLIERGFEERGEVKEVEKSGVMSSSTEKVWKIGDGPENSMNRKYCRETGLDIYGFSRDDTRPSEAVGVLRRKIVALKRQFNGANTEN